MYVVTVVNSPTFLAITSYSVHITRIGDSVTSGDEAGTHNLPQQSDFYSQRDKRGALQRTNFAMFLVKYLPAQRRNVLSKTSQAV